MTDSTINVKVLFFASLRDDVGHSELEVQIAEPSLNGLLQGLDPLLAEPGKEAIRAENVKIARNQQLWEGQTPLDDGDEVAFLPPVTGG